MYIESLQLSNFRNYEFLDLDFDRGTNILYGDNAQGKTNILEALYLCGTGRSHRGSRDKDLIRFGEEEAHIRLLVKKDQMSSRIDMHLKKSRTKGVAVNGLPIHRTRELLGIINLVFFSPEDLNIIKSGPSERRKFIDLELCQLEKMYISDLTSYNQVLNQRNRLLKDIYFKPSLKETLDIWDEQLLEHGKRIISERRTFIGELNSIIKSIHEGLTGGRESIEIFYEPNTVEEEFSQKLRSGREKDLKMKTTSTGPHRDDLCVKVNGIDIRKYGSQGQQRTAALSIKLSEIVLVKKRTGDTPVLLLDDVLSELDSSRQNDLMNSIHDIQTVITCTGLDDFVSHQFEINKVFHVVKGNIL